MPSVAGSRRFALLMAGVLAWGLGLGSASATSRLLFVPVAESAEQALLESRVEEELLLALDEVAVDQRAVEQSDFSSLPVAQQLQALEPWSTDPDVLAVGWLDAHSSDRLRLHLVLGAEGRSVLRVVEADKGEEGPAALALAVREVLSLILTSRQRAAQKKEESGDTTTREVERISPDSHEAKITYRLSLVPGIGVRSVDLTGPETLGFVQLGFELGFRKHVSLEIQGHLVFTEVDPAPGLPTLLSGGGGVQLRWLPGTDRVGAGPLFTMLLLNTRLELAGAELSALQHLDLRLGPGFGFRFDPVPEIGLLLQVAADFMPRVWDARRRATGDVVFEGSAVELRLGVGVRIRLPGGRSFDAK